MRKGFVLVLVGLLALIATSVTLAQDGLPWTITPQWFDGPPATDTVEIELSGAQDVHDGECIQVDFDITVEPKNFRAFVDSAGRYSIEVMPLLQRAIVGSHSLCIKLEQLSLEDPVHGIPDGKTFFDSKKAKSISKLGIHIWDDSHQTQMVINGAGLVVVKDAPMYMSLSTTCVEAKAEAVITTFSARVDFRTDVSEDKVIAVIYQQRSDDRVFPPVTIKLRIMAGAPKGEIQFVVSQEFVKAHPEWMQPYQWYLMYKCQ